MKTKYNILGYSLIKNLLLFFADIFSFWFSLWLAINIRNILPRIISQIEFPFFNNYAYQDSELIVFLGIMFIVFVWNNLYQNRLTFWEELLIIWKSLLISCLMSYLFLFNFTEALPYMSRIVIMLLFIFLMFVLPLFRVIIKFILFKMNFGCTPMIVACHQDDFEKAQHIKTVFKQDFYLGFVPIGFFIENGVEVSHELPIYTEYESIPNHTAVCVLENPMDNHLLNRFFSEFRKVYMIPNTSTLGFKGLGGQYLFTERLLILKIENRLNSWIAQFMKNIFDRILGMIIVLLLCPMFLIIALIIKIKSPGPIFFRQKRIGKNGKEFKMWKFRTMYVDAEQKLEQILQQNVELKKEWDTFFKLKNDPRIIPIGHFLRKYSLDEFPQLFNVLAGEMSLIGPRPFIRGEIEEIDASLLPLFAQVKPGLTGLWQISGRNQHDRLEKINIDIWYIHHWSLSLDLLILLNTPIAVLSARGAS